MQVFSPETLLNKISTQVFSVNIAKFLKRLNLKNICEQLFERFPTWENNITSNIGIEEDIFSKQTKEKILKLSYVIKTCLFMMLLIISFFSISPLHVSGGVCPTKQKMIVGRTLKPLD